MRAIFDSRRLVSTVTSAVALLLCAGCGGEKQTQARMPTAPPVRAVGRAIMPPAEPPNTPTASNVAISSEVMRACNIPDGDAYFAFDSSKITGFDYKPLDAVATCFTHGPLAGRRMRLIGHADPRGAADYNMTLGQSRADSVATYLTERGVSSANASTTSRGAMDATGHDETSWAHDRRVDVMLAN